jgi:hypothetical protein
MLPRSIVALTSGDNEDVKKQGFNCKHLNKRKKLGH